MSKATPRYSSDPLSMEWPSTTALVQHHQTFSAGVRAAVESEGFPKAEFVRRLFDYRIALDEDWRRRVDQSTMFDARNNEFQDRLVRRALQANNPRDRDEAWTRFGKRLCASMERDRQLSREAEGLAAPGLISHVVFNALDSALLSDRHGLWTMLDCDGTLFHDAVAALTRIGPPALEFADFLMERLDRQRHAGAFDGASALAAIGQGNADVVNSLLTRLRHEAEPLWTGAADVLERMGPPLAGRDNEAVQLLLQMTRLDDPRYRVDGALGALASLGRDRDDALTRVLEVAAPRPPRWHADESCPGLRFDLTMSPRGKAIDSLPYFQRFADRVVPALVEAFDAFEEYDPDYQYYGEHDRVSTQPSDLAVVVRATASRQKPQTIQRTQPAGERVGQSLLSLDKAGTRR